MKVNRKNFLKALTAVKPGIASKELIEQTTSFMFTDGYVSTYNDEIAISHPIDVDIEGAVPAKELFAILNRRKEEEIEIEISSSELLIKTKKSMAGITMESKVSTILEEIVEPEEWFDLPPAFMDGVKFCLFCASTDMSQPILTCLHLYGDVIQTSDNHRIAQYNVDIEGSGREFIEPVLLPASYAEKLNSFAPYEYGITEGWIHFKCKGEAIYSCRTYEGEFPDVTQYIGIKGDKLRLPAAISELIEKAEIFLSSDFESDTYIEIELKDGMMRLESHGQVGWFKEESRIRYNGINVKFCVHPSHLKAILSSTTTCVIGDGTMEFISPEFTYFIVLSEV